MKPSHMNWLFLVTLAGLSQGCLDAESGLDPVSHAEAVPSPGANTSDRTKPNYRPDLDVEKREVSLQERLDRTPGYKGLKDYQDRVQSQPMRKTASEEYWVGVLPAFQTGLDACPAADRVELHQDDEDNKNASKTSSALPRGAGDGDGRNTRMWFCKVPGVNLRPLGDAYYFDDARVTNEYAVLKLDDACPPSASGEFAIKVDNEDDNNKNFNSGNIWPNYQDHSYTKLNFCYFGATSDLNAPRLPSLPYVGGDYVVFASSAAGTGAYFKQKYWVYSDDEDDSNDNAWFWNGQSSGQQTRIKRIINTTSTGTSGTMYNMAAIQP